MVGMHVYSMYRAYLFSRLQELLLYGSNCYNLIRAPFTSPRGFSAYNF